MAETKIGLIKSNVAKVMVGNEETVDLLLTCLLSGGHCLLEDVPGTGKTVMAKSIAKSIGGEFARIQFTPDLLPSDITGLYYYNKKEEEFIFRPGPAFANIILGDELNRATPRTQSALLECMEEKQITIEGRTHELSEPFFVIATENPVESSGTFPLPEAQLDRFLMRLSMEKPDRDNAMKILKRFNNGDPLKALQPVCTPEDVLQMRKDVGDIYVDERIYDYILNIIDATARQAEVAVGASTRSSISLLHAAKAYAYVQGRTFVVPEDVKLLAPKVLAHRLLLNRSSRWKADKAEEVVERILRGAEVPTEDWKNASSEE